VILPAHPDIILAIEVIQMEHHMELAIPPETKKIIDDCVSSGEFASAEEVIAVAVHRLKEPQLFGDFAPGELDRLLEEGKNSGPPIPLETFKAEMEVHKAAFMANRK
jgi:Arc/MetJ-type ribon-helix-helix transcriptional regulator